MQSHDIQEFIPLINQLVTKYKEKISPFLREVFMPVVQSIISCLNLPFDPSDTDVRMQIQQCRNSELGNDVYFVRAQEQRDRLNLQRSYFLFISALATNNVTEVIASQGVVRTQLTLCAPCERNAILSLLQAQKAWKKYWGRLSREQ